MDQRYVFYEVYEVDVIFCKLCLKSITDRTFKAVGEVPLEVLSALIPNLEARDGYMCNDCSAKLFAAYDFKMMCLDTENSLVIYVSADKVSQVDLRGIYLKVREGEYAIATVNQQVCRLCMRILDEGFMPFENLRDAITLNKYIPEVNFSITKDPVVCKQCWNSLDMYIDCLSRWTSVKDIKTNVQDPDDNLCVKNEEIDLKFEEHNENGDLSLHESIDNILKGRTINETEEIHRNNDNKSSSNSNLVVFQSRDKDCSEVRMHQCDTCHYETNDKYEFVNHLSRHKGLAEVLCRDESDYQSSTERGALTKHQIVHKEPSEIQTFKCGECNFETKWPHHLKQHQVKHDKSSQVQLYKCGKCDYQSKWKGSIRKHQLVHMDPLEVQMYKCDKCDFESRKKYLVKRHLVKHEKSSEGVQVQKE